jgi:hypothetical protein
VREDGRKFTLSEKPYVSNLDGIKLGFLRQGNLRADHDRDRVKTAIAVGVGIDPDEAFDNECFDARFFVELTAEPLFEGFAPFERAARKCPEARRSLNE